MNKVFKIAATLSVFVYSVSIFAQQKDIDASSIVSYILAHQKENGAFGPDHKEYTDLAWNYPAISTLKILGATVPREQEAFDNGHKSWIEINSRKNGPWYWSFFQKTQLYELFNISDIDFEEGIKRGQDWNIQFKSRETYLEEREYQNGLFFDMSSLWHMIKAVTLLDGNVTNKHDVETYIKSRQAKNGAFVDDVTDTPTPTNAETNLIITSYAVLTLKSLGIDVFNKEKCIEWIQSCQTEEGGFRYSPDSKASGNHTDVWYTWAAIIALKALDSKPKNTKQCKAWLNSLQNYDGGFGDRPGWKSRLYSSYYAVSALHELTGDATSAITSKQRKNNVISIPEDKYLIFQAHQKSPAGGDGMVDSIAAMGLNLVGVKSLQKNIDLDKGVSQGVVNNRIYARQKKYQLEILELPENYSHKLIWPNRQLADHISNFLIPPDLSSSEGEAYKKAFEAGQVGLTWEMFKQKVIQPIKNLRAGTLFYPELDYTMLNAYRIYDEGLDGGAGYNAVPAAHFGNIDWVRHFPYKERWEGLLPMVADGDAHGNIVKWRKNLLQFRNVYIASSYHFEDYINASLNARSVCVILMPSGAVRYYGSEAAIAYLKKHIKEWQWWED